MAISIANLTSGEDTDGNSTATTASITPSANKLVLLTVASRTGITAQPNQPTVTGCGLTWVAIASSFFDTSGASQRKVSMFRALGASLSTGSLTIDFGGQNQTAVGWVLDECTGADTSGTNGSGAVVQSATNQDTSGSGTSLTVTLGAFGSTANATYGGFGDGDGTVATTAGSGFTKIGETNVSTALGTTTEFLASNDTTVDLTWAVGVEIGGIAIEIKAAYPGDGSWTVSAQIQADHTKVSGASDLTNFPVLIKDGNIPASIYSAMQATGADLRITTDSAGTTEIPFEIVSITPASSLAEVWAKVPTLLTASATSLYLWAGNANAIAYDANAPFGSQAVWTNYKAVYHEQTLTADSTANAYTLTNTGTVVTATSQIGTGADFGASNSTKRLSVSSAPISLMSDYTISTWVKLNTEIGAGTYQLFHLENNTNKHTLYLKYEYNAGTRRLRFEQARWVIAGYSAYYTTTLGTSNWHKIDYTLSGTSMTIYLDGVAGTPGTMGSLVTGDTTTNNQLVIGAGTTEGTGTYVEYASSIQDENRLIQSALSSDWIATEYANQNSPSTFWTQVSGVRHLGLLGVGN